MNSSIENSEKKNKVRYTFTLDGDLVKEAEQLISGFGGKLSPLVETLLRQFVENAKLSPEKLVLTKEEQIKKLKAMEERPLRRKNKSWIYLEVIIYHE